MAMSVGCFSLYCLVAVAQGPDFTAELEKRGAKVTRVAGVATQVQVEAASFTPADFQVLGRCATLRKISINGKTLNDETLPLLSGLLALEELSTNNTDLSDEGYRHFAAFKNLKPLALFHPSWDKKGFTGRGLAHLKALPKLEKLTYAGASTGDEALAAVGELRQLKDFSTWHTMQTQAGNGHLAKLSSLAALRLGQRLPRGNPAPAASLDESTLKTISQFSGLEKLELFEARLTAQGLMPLKNLSKLKRLVIHTCDVSATDIDALRKSLPGVAIEFKPMTDADRDATLVKKLRI